MPMEIEDLNLESLPPGTRIPLTAIARRYHRSIRTIDRWIEDPAVEFPPIIYIRGRRYVTAGDALVWEQKQPDLLANKKATGFAKADAPPRREKRSRLTQKPPRREPDGFFYATREGRGGFSGRLPTRIPFARACALAHGVLLLDRKWLAGKTEGCCGRSLARQKCKDVALVM